MKMAPHRIVLIVLVAFFLLMVALLGGLLFYKEVIYKEEKTDAILVVEEVYFVLAQSNTESYRISVKVFISNDGEKDCDAKVRGFIIDKDSNLAMDDTEAAAGRIPAGKTVETSLEMEVLYNGSFRVELLVFKDGLITVKGSGNINLAQFGTGGKDYSNTVTDPTEEDEKGSALPFPGIGVAIVTSTIVALTYGYLNRRRRWSR